MVFGAHLAVNVRLETCRIVIPDLVVAKVGRLGSVAEELDAAPLGAGADLQSLFAFLATQVA